VTTLDATGVQAGDAGRAFLHSVGAEVDRIFEEHRSGQLDLDASHRRVLAEARDAIHGCSDHPDAGVRGRLAMLLGRIDALLDGSAGGVERSDEEAQAETAAVTAASSSDVFQFLTAFRESSPPAEPIEPRAAPASDAPVSERPGAAAPVHEAPVAQAHASWDPPPATGWARPVAGPSVPATPVASDRGGRRHLWERVVMASVLAVTALVLSLIAVHNNDAAAKWRRLDLAQAQISTNAAHQLATANGNITKLNGEIKSLDGYVSNMQSQLASVANQKEKALDQTTVFKDLLAAAGQVANNLTDCIAATNQLNVDVNSAVTSGNASALPTLETEAGAVAQTCAYAQQGNNALQAAIQSAA